MNSPLLLLLASLAACIGLLKAITVPVSYDDPKCGGPQPTKTILCYYEGGISLGKVDPCLCTHIVFSGNTTTVRSDNSTVSLTTDIGNSVRTLRRRNPELVTVLRVKIPGETPLIKSERRSSFVSSLGRIVRTSDLNGIELLLQAPQQISNSAQAREGLSKLLKLLRKELGVQKTHRSRRDYSVFETIEDDVSTEAYSPFRKPSIRGTRTTAEGSITSFRHKTILRSARTDDDGQAREALRDSLLALEKLTPKERVILLNLPAQPELLVKRYDLKALSKYADLFVLPTHNLTDISEHGYTYHPSRLMGLSDLLNTDSLVDLVTGLGASRDKLVISIPSQAIQFTLKNATRNTPRSRVTSGPKYLTQTQLCGLMTEGGWTIERDEDLTAPYAFRNKTWLAFDDSVSIGIKSKYVLLRDLAGAAVFPIDSMDWEGACHQKDNKTFPAQLLKDLRSAFTTLARKSRGAVLQTLQEDIHTSSLVTFSGEVHLSPYRIVRVVDNQGAVHVVRKDVKTRFECSRQGYFRHPLGCNRFYRCVKFNQYLSDFTVFEYDCPAGLAFDERWEVCVWPGSLPESACHGSSEIAPVPRARYACPAIEGYYADPENCRWFFACLDHARDGASPLTAYEFRCPFGLVFDQRNLVCQWPWLVDGCGYSGVYLGGYSGAIAFGSGAGRGFAATAGGGSGAAGYTGKSSIVYETGSAAAQDIFGSSGIVGQVAASYISGGSASGGEGRHIDSYASFPDYLVSGGRIDKSGGVVLEGNLALSGVDRGQLRYSSGRGSYQEGGSAHQASGAGSGAYLATGAGYNTGAAAHSSSFRVDGAAGRGAGVALGSRGGAAGSIAVGELVNGNLVETHGASGSVLLAGEALGIRSGATGTLGGGVAYGTHVETFGNQGGAVLAAGETLGSRSGATGTLGAGVAYGTHVETFGNQGGAVLAAGEALGSRSGATGTLGAGVTYGTHDETFGNRGSAALTADEALGSRSGATGTLGAGVAYGTHVETFGNRGSAALAAGEALGSRIGTTGTVGAGVAYGTHVETFGNRGAAKLAAGEALGSQHGALGAGVSYGVRVDKFETQHGATLAAGQALGSRGGTGVSYGTHVETAEVHGNQGGAYVDLGAGLAYGTRIDTSGSIGRTGTLRGESGVSVSQGPAVVYGAQVGTFGSQGGAYNAAGEALGSGHGATVAQRTGGAAYVETFGGGNGVYSGTSQDYGTQSQIFGNKAGIYQSQNEGSHSVVFEANKINSGIPIAAVQPSVATYQQTVVPKVHVASVHSAVPVSTVDKIAVPKVPLQPAVATYQETVVPKVPIATVQTAVPVTTYQQNVVSQVVQPAVETYQQTLIPKVSVSSVNAVPVASYQHTVVPKIQIQPAVKAYEGNTEAKVSISSVHSSVPVTTYQQNIVPKLQIQPAVATYQPTIVPKVRVQPTITTYQQNIAPRVRIQPAVATYQQAILPKVESATVKTALPIESYQEIVQPNVEIASLNSAIPVNTYQETLVPKVSVSSAPTAVPVVAYQQTAVPRIRVRPTQPAVVVSTYHQAQQPEIQVSAVHPTVSTVLETSKLRIPFARVQPTTLARTYQQTLTPQVPISTAVPVLQVASVQPNVQPKVFLTGSRRYSSRARPSVSVENSGSAGYVSPASAVFTTSAPVASLPSASYSYSSTPAPAAEGYSFVTPANQFLTGVVSTTPAPRVHGYSRTSSKAFLSSPAVQDNYEKTPIVVSTTAVPVDVGYSYSGSSGDTASTIISGAPSTTASPISTGYSYRRPSVPAVPAAPEFVYTPRPDEGYLYSNPSVSLTSGDASPSRIRVPISTPATIVDYSYSKSTASDGSRSSGRSRLYSTTAAAIPTLIESFTPATVAVDYSVPFASGAVSSSGPSFVSNDYAYRKSSISAGGRKLKPTESPAEIAARLGVGLEPATPSPALFNLPTFDNVEVAKYGNRFQPAVKYSTPAPTYVSVTPTVLTAHNCTASSPTLRVNNIGYRGQYDFGQRSTGFVSTTAVPTVAYSTTTAPSTTATNARASLSSSTPQYQANNVGTRRGGVKTKVSYEDSNVEALLNKYSGNFGGLFNNEKQEFIDEVISTGGRGRQYSSTTTAYSTSTTAPRGKAKFGTADEEPRVVVVTRLSDINPLLVAKLGAQCTCKPESPVLRKKPSDSEDTAYAADLASPRGYPSSAPEHVPSAPLPGSGLVTGSELSPDDNLGVLVSSSVTPLSSSTTPRTVLITTSRPRARSRNQYSPSTTPLYVSTTTSPSFAFTDDNAGALFRARPQPSTSASIKIPASRPRGRTLDVISSTAVPILSNTAAEFEANANARGQLEAGVGGGRAFDRYGPGGWRGIDETLQGSVDCQRPGLFRHPKYCNKFYACHWDQWKGRYTLHVFNCPVHLAYDNSLGACNWPSKGPACTDDNLLV